MAALATSHPHRATANPAHRLVCQTRTLEVNGKAATVFSLGADGALPGLALNPDARFSVALENRLAEPGMTTEIVM